MYQWIKKEIEGRKKAFKFDVLKWGLGEELLDISDLCFVITFFLL